MIELDMESLLAEENLVVDQAQISPNLSKMTASKSEEKSSEFKKYVKGLVQCTVCIKLIKTTPIHQCTDGHVICKDCIPKLNNVRVKSTVKISSIFVAFSENMNFNSM